jgi:hypothetical protein
MPVKRRTKELSLKMIFSLSLSLSLALQLIYFYMYPLVPASLVEKFIEISIGFLHRKLAYGAP